MPFRIGIMIILTNKHQMNMIFKELITGLLPLFLTGKGDYNRKSAHTQFRGSKLLFDLETLCMLSEI